MNDEPVIEQLINEDLLNPTCDQWKWKHMEACR